MSARKKGNMGKRGKEMGEFKFPGKEEHKRKQGSFRGSRGGLRKQHTRKRDIKIIGGKEKRKNPGGPYMI